MRQIALSVRRAGESALFRIQRLGAYRYLARRSFGAGAAIRGFMPGDEAQIAGLFCAGVPDIKESAKNIAEEGVWLVAERGGRIVGSTAAAPAREDPRAWMIYSLLVRPVSRRLGIGARLVEAATQKARAKGAVTIGLFVNNGSYAPLGLYKKLGFARREAPDPGAGVSADHIYLERRLQ